MKQLDLIIRNQTGLHARPARVFVDIAKQFQSTIRIGHGQKLVNAKSLISVLTLGVTSGQRISIDVDGADEAAAIAALEAAVWSGLGEELVDLEENGHPEGQPRTENHPERTQPRAENPPASSLQPPARRMWCMAWLARPAWRSGRSISFGAPRLWFRPLPWGC